jgi:hypothetical protein
LDAVGKTKGKMESNQIERIFANGGGNNPGFVREGHHDAAGDRVEFDFVADQSNLERVANGADNHPGSESLYFGIAPTVAPLELGHDHSGMGSFPDTPDFTGSGFYIVDVFSLYARYADRDEGPGGVTSARAAALDYDLYFRIEGGGVVHGIPLVDFAFGWTTSTFVDDYIVRWRSPEKAVGVYILARNSGGHDGNVQIDAIIASDIPEPATWLLPAAGLMGILARGRLRRV